MAQPKLKRKPCFSDEEIRCLVDSFGEHKDLLLSKLNNSATNQKKKKVWAEITTSVNARAVHVKRTVDEVKKKWKDLLSKAKKDASSQMNPPTGGGPCQKISPYSDIILSIYGKELPSVVGIANGIESASASVPLAVEEGNECREYDAASPNGTEGPISPENDQRLALSTSEHPEIGDLEACSSEIELQLVEGKIDVLAFHARALSCMCVNICARYLTRDLGSLQILQ